MCHTYVHCYNDEYQNPIRVVIYMYISIYADVPACINCLHLCKYEDTHACMCYIKVHMLEKNLYILIK